MSEIFINLIGLGIIISTIQQALINPFGEPVWMGVFALLLWFILTKV